MIGKLESGIIGLLLLLLGPFLAFAPAVLVSYEISTVRHIPQRLSAYTALAAAAAAFVVVLLRARFWIAKFYSCHNFVTVPVCLLLAGAVLCLCMGLPSGNLILGAGAGLYVGRKYHHLDATPPEFREHLRRVSLFATALMGLIALCMGYLAVQENATLASFLYLVRLHHLAATETGRTLIVAGAIPALMVLQYGLTRRVALIGFRRGE